MQLAPIVLRLRESIKLEEKRANRACLMAELACYFARVGEYLEAERLKFEIRQEFGKGESLQVTVHLMCLDALLIYYTDTNQKSRDRMAGAHLLSRSAGDRDLVALTSSWLAHFDYNYKNFDAMGRYITECLSNLGSATESAECRLSVVLGDAFLYSRDNTASLFWYDRARNLAVRLGDQSVFGAIAYNKASLKTGALRFLAAESAVEQEMIRRVDAEIESSVNYQSISGQKSLGYLIEMMRVSMCMLKGDYLGAEVVLTTLLASHELSSRPDHLRLHRADRILVLANTDRKTEAVRQIVEIEDELKMPGEADDKAVTLSSFIKAANLCGMHEVALRWTTVLRSEIEKHQAQLAHLTAVLVQCTPHTLQ